jgi:hypothetical protein
MFSINEEAFIRGMNDASRGKAPLFRKVGEKYESCIEDDMADNWSQLDRASYIQGYSEYVGTR